MVVLMIVCHYLGKCSCFDVLTDVLKHLIFILAALFDVAFKINIFKCTKLRLHHYTLKKELLV